MENTTLEKLWDDLRIMKQTTLKDEITLADIEKLEFVNERFANDLIDLKEKVQKESVKKQVIEEITPIKQMLNQIGWEFEDGNDLYESLRSAVSEMECIWRDGKDSDAYDYDALGLAIDFLRGFLYRE